MTDVFISYKREERWRVERLAQVLTALKLDIWFDARLDSGVHFDAEIAQELTRAKAILVLWSPAAYGSEWVRGEAMKGLQRKVLAAAFVEPTDLFPPFNTVHADDLMGFLAEGREGRWDDPGLLRLLDRLGNLTGRRGLAGFARARAAGTFEALKTWAAANLGDPLENDAWELAQEREIAAARAKVQQARDAAARAGAQAASSTAYPASPMSSASQRSIAPPGMVGMASAEEVEGPNLAQILGAAFVLVAIILFFIMSSTSRTETSLEEEVPPPVTEPTTANMAPAAGVTQLPSPKSPVNPPSAPLVERKEYTSDLPQYLPESKDDTFTTVTPAPAPRE